MNRLQSKLIVIFLAATLVPWGATLWITTRLIDRSLQYRSTGELDDISKSLETTGREYYLQAREDLKSAAAAGKITPHRYPVRDRAQWPEPLENFWAGGDAEQFTLAGSDGERLDYFVRQPNEVLVYSRPLSVAMHRLSAQYQRARDLVNAGKNRDLRRGFIYTWVLLASTIWLTSLIVLALLARHISRPIGQLTEGLAELAAGNFAVRLTSRREDEIGRAIAAFNHSAEQLEQNRDRLIYLTQLASWQTLARKMAHEVKNSLTPIRLTVEEMVARHAGADRKFLEQAAQIVIDEVESLERRVRAFSQFSSEPPVRARDLDLNAVVEDRVSFLKSGHPEVQYAMRLSGESPRALADEDLVKGILVNLLENAAEAAGPGGNVLAATHVSNGRAAVEVHDSGPGLSEAARGTLFQPTISFKKNGMGLGLSIARKSALASGGDIIPINSELGGAGFRLVLPNSNGIEKSSDR
ncbi:MAG TPA: HAMP domain-containing sensor histidine kinase [Bryobacteraceae bacterium]|nr:HAMP domain-containing sensor histidine kinase [Bryobacteraceae bacterium]